MRPDDALKYAYARMRATAEWTLDSIGGSMCDHRDLLPFGEPRSWRGTLSSGDPDIPSPGIFEVSTDPSTQQIHTRVIRIAGGAS